MLTDGQIKAFIKQGRISIDPFDESKVETSVYKVSLGALLLAPLPGQIIDLRNTDSAPEYEKISLTEDGYLLKPKEFILGQTMEKLALDGDIAAFIDGRSTLARLGISIHQSATLIQPGQDAHIIVLEIFNAGLSTIRIYPGLAIGKLTFFLASQKNQVNMRDYGRYIGQDETTGARFSHYDLMS